MKRNSKVKVHKISDVYDFLIEHETAGGFEFNTSFTVENEVLSVASDGSITTKTVTTNYSINVISMDEFKLFLVDHYDWSFIAYDNGFSSMSALATLWGRFLDHNRDNFTRALRDMYYEYNPIYNYDRNEVHYYNIHDNGDETESGEYKHTITDTGDEVRRHSGSNATSSTTQYGGDGSYIETGMDWSNPDMPTTSAKAQAGTGVEMKTQNYSNSFENDDTGTASNRMTDSQVQSGTVSDNGVIQDAYVDTTQYIGRERTDVIDWGDKGHVTDKKNDHTGQDGTKAVGNIGVTTSTAMVAEDVQFRMKTNVASMILDKFATETFFMGVDNDDDFDWFD